jgi:hypothetical protein
MASREPAMPAEALHLGVVLNLCHDYTKNGIVVTRHSENTHLVAR